MNWLLYDKDFHKRVRTLLTHHTKKLCSYLLIHIVKQTLLFLFCFFYFNLGFVLPIFFIYKTSVEGKDYFFTTSTRFTDTKGYLTRMVSLRVEFFPSVKFASVSGQTDLSINMLNRSKMSPLPLYGTCLKDRRKTHAGIIRHDCNV